MTEVYPGCWLIRDSRVGDITIESRKYQEEKKAAAVGNDKPYFCIRTIGNGEMFSKGAGQIHIHRVGLVPPDEASVIEAVETAWTLLGVGGEDVDSREVVEQTLGEGWEGW